MLLDTLPGPSTPQSFAGSRHPETQPRSPPLKPRALDPSFAGPLTPMRGTEETSRRWYLSQTACASADSEKRPNVGETETNRGESGCAGPSPRHRIDVWLGLGERGCLWIRGSNCSPGDYEAESSLPVPSPMPGHGFIHFTAPTEAVPR